MRVRSWGALALSVVGVGVTGDLALADPCGMVPPIYSGPGKPIERVGAQKTYVYFDQGVESVAIRPGFRGQVEQFGMLIPFPSVPELRKLPDDVFPHIASAIDPPVPTFWVRRYSPKFSRRSGVQMASKSKSAEPELALDTVKVLKQEAVGMYEVAVLAAGSANALKKWMDEHGYRYPDGMEAPTNDYVKAGWCFVAVKTKVGQKKGVDPRPGLRKVDSKMPTGASFSGHVQAMGFRFRTKELVLPMRLSAFNGGRLRNIVYLLTNRPMKINGIAHKYVVRQISGSKLFNNVSKPLPFRVKGGTYEQLRSHQKENVKRRRDPAQYNRYAKELFATDAYAIKSRQLSLPYEEEKKELLRIGERLLLRGPQIDQLNQASLARKVDRAVRKALARIKQMTLTVIDGDFPRKVIADDNLSFSRYRMPGDLNTTEHYDARNMGPSRQDQSGILYGGPIKNLKKIKSAALHQEQAPRHRPWWALGIGLFFGGLFMGRRRGGSLFFILVVAASMLAATSGRAWASDVDRLIDQLGDNTTSAAAVAKLIALGEKALPDLLDEAFDGTDAARRGWAIVCLGEIGGPTVGRELEKIQKNANHGMLVRTWAAAARIKMAKSFDDYVALAPLAGTFPALQRPLGMGIASALAGDSGPKDVGKLLEIAANNYKLQQVLTPAILGFGAKPLVKTMITHSSQNVRRQAAAYLATVAQRGDDSVALEVMKAYSFDVQAKDVPWAGGPLFLPSLNWKKYKDGFIARELVANLISWHVWADVRKKPDLQKQIHNNLRSLSLARAAGYNSPGWRAAPTETWLKIWGAANGKKALKDLLLKQGYGTYREYRHVLDKL